jgi:hypothetical protein
LGHSVWWGLCLVSGLSTSCPLRGEQPATMMFCLPTGPESMEPGTTD